MHNIPYHFNYSLSIPFRFLHCTPRQAIQIHHAWCANARLLRTCVEAKSVFSKVHTKTVTRPAISKYSYIVRIAPSWLVASSWPTVLLHACAPALARAVLFFHASPFHSIASNLMSCNSNTSHHTHSIFCKSSSSQSQNCAISTHFTR